MDWDTLDPPPKKPEKPKLEEMSIEALHEYIGDLEAEIARVREAIALKEDARGGAEAFFKK